MATVTSAASPGPAGHRDPPVVASNGLGVDEPGCPQQGLELVFAPPSQMEPSQLAPHHPAVGVERLHPVVGDLELIVPVATNRFVDEVGAPIGVGAGAPQPPPELFAEVD